MQATRRYVLGGYSFDSVDEYWNAQQDMKKIDIISNELDVRDPEVAIRLYNFIRDGKISFSSPIGAEFTEHVTDVLADKSIGLLDDRDKVETAEKKAKRQLRLGACVVSLAVIAGLIFGSTQVKEILTTRNLEAMATTTRAAKVDDAARDEIAKGNAAVLEAAAEARRNAAVKEDNFNPETLVNEATLTVLPEYATLAATYPDLKGWLRVSGTNIDYPVMQRAGDVNNEYYLDKSYDGSHDSNGSLFIDYRSNTVNPTENTIIYGHNMNSGMMFGDLKSYLDESYFNSHKSVSFDTLYEERHYEIVAVCLSKVQDANADAFRYYNFIDAKNEAEWEAFVQNINSLSVFSANVGLEPGDEVLTLSTCNNYTEDGRLFLVAKRIV